MKLIDGDALIAWIKESQQMTSKMKAVVAKIKTMPSADIDLSEYSDKLWRNAYERGKADRPQGKWIEHKERTIVRNGNFIDFFPTEYECSNCGLREAHFFINSKPHNFCPNCGCRMKGADDE